MSSAETRRLTGCIALPAIRERRAVAECGKRDRALRLDGRSGCHRQAHLQSVFGRPQSRNWCGLMAFDWRAVVLGAATVRVAEPVSLRLARGREPALGGR